MSKEVVKEVTLDELLEKEKLNRRDISRFLKSADLKRLKKADLDLLVRKFGNEVLDMAEFSTVYDRKVKESNRRLFYWMLLFIFLSGSIGAWKIFGG